MAVDPRDAAALVTVARRALLAVTAKGLRPPLDELRKRVLWYHPDGGGDEEARIGMAATAVALLNASSLDSRAWPATASELDPELKALMAAPPTAPPEQIVLAWLVLLDRPTPEADQVLLAELCHLCLSAADRLREWDVLGDEEDGEGIRWAHFAFNRIVAGCHCRVRSCERLHDLRAWLAVPAHGGPGDAVRRIGLCYWLERACAGHSPAFALPRTFSQGLIAAAEPALDVGNAAMRVCRCAQDQALRLLSKGRTCPGCGCVPDGVIRLVPKIVHRETWVPQRFVRCPRHPGPVKDQRFFELSERRCPEPGCGWEPTAAPPPFNECPVDGARFPAEEAACPQCDWRVPPKRGLVRAWVYRPPPAAVPFDPAAGPPTPAGRRGRGAAAIGLGLSFIVCERLLQVRSEGVRGAQRVGRFVRALAAVSPEGRLVDGLLDAPSTPLRDRLRDALAAVCHSIRDEETRALLRADVERVLAEWEREE